MANDQYTISGFCVIFILGAALQAGATTDVGFIYGKSSFVKLFAADLKAGRTISGLGVGALSMLIPMYNAELAPPGIRGSLVALQQLAITFGILVAYWIGYGTNCKHAGQQDKLIFSHWRNRRTRTIFGCMANSTGATDRTCDGTLRRIHVLTVLTSMAHAQGYGIAPFMAGSADL